MVKTMSEKRAFCGTLRVHGAATTKPSWRCHRGAMPLSCMVVTVTIYRHEHATGQTLDYIVQIY